MSRKSPRLKKLTEYETCQVEKIAVWKSASPNPFGELFRRGSQPIAKVVEIIIPDRLALLSIEATYKLSLIAATKGDIWLEAGVADISKLRHEPLEVCDRLSRRVGTFAQTVATIEGALTGAGGVWTTVLDIPLLFGLCLRTIIKIGYCYGYPLDQPTDKAWVLGAFAVVLSGTKQKRIELMARLREIEDLMLEETQEQLVVEEAAALLTQIEVFQDIPIFGAATGAALNFSVAHKTDVTARHLFQERWLRDNGKVDAILPAPDDTRVPSRPGWSGAFARAGYTMVHGLSFGATFPVCLVTTILGSVARPVASKLREGGPATNTRTDTAGDIKLAAEQSAQTANQGLVSPSPKRRSYSSFTTE